MLLAPAGCCAVLPSLFEFRPEQFHLPPFDDLIDGQVSLLLPEVLWLSSTDQVQQLISTPANRLRSQSTPRLQVLNPETLLYVLPWGHVEPAQGSSCLVASMAWSASNASQRALPAAGGLRGAALQQRGAMLGGLLGCSSGMQCLDFLRRLSACCRLFQWSRPGS